jgi:uncharacterized protein involved in exopolysaccharide biosynthesis
MNISQLAGIVRGRLNEALVVFGIVCVMAIAIIAIIPPQFTAQSSVVLNLRSPETSSSISLPGGLVSTHIATQIDVLQSESVILRAVQSLALDSDPEWQRAWKAHGTETMPFGPWVAERLTKKLKVKPETDSSVLTVSFTANDPVFAARFVNALVQAYIDTSLDMRLEPARRYSKYFDERASALRQTIEQAQSRLAAFQKANGLIVTEEKVNLEVDRLKELNTKLTELQAVVAESSARSSRARATPERMQEVLNDKVVSALAEELSLQEAKLAELNERLGDNNPTLIELRSRIHTLRQRRDAAIQRTLGSIQIGANVNQTQLKELQQELKTQQQLVMDLESKHAEVRLLQREIENAQRAYDAVLAKASQAALQSGDTQPEVAVLKVATPPSGDGKLRWIKFGGAGIAAAAALGLLFIFLREQMDRKVRTGHDIVDSLQQQLLVTVPSMGMLTTKNNPLLPFSVKRVRDIVALGKGRN